MKPIDITDQNFDEEVLKSTTPVLVDFWAPWCTPCQVAAPIVDELAEELGDKIKFLKLNLDENPVKASQFQVLSIPNFKIFKDGKVLDEIVGVPQKAEFQAFLKKVL